MDQKGIAPLVVVVIIVAAVAIGTGAYVATRGGDEGGEGDGVGKATSLDFTVDSTAMGQTSTVRWRAKNIGTDDWMLRIDTTLPVSSILILNVAQNKAWGYGDNEWTNFSANFQDYFQLYTTIFQEYVDQFSGWTGGDWTYTVGDVTIRFYDIVVNPDLPDSLFQPS